MILLRKKTIEDYVEVLYNIQKNKDKVHTNDVASYLNINPASVTEIFQKLDKEGYINYEKYIGVSLTKKGTNLAQKTKNKHEKLTEFLIILGVDKTIAENDACEMEHILHSDTMDTIVKFVEVINKCEFTPFWLERFIEYVKTGNLSECPAEFIEICKKYQKIKKEK